MFKILKSPLDAWKWVGDYEVDLQKLPVTARQVPSRFNAVLGGVVSFVCIVVPLFGGTMAVTQDGEPAGWVIASFAPIVLVGLGLIPLVVLSFRSGRSVVFGRVGVAVRGKWFRRREDWSAPYSEFRGVDWMTRSVWAGRSTRTFYVVQLRHRDPEKTIPLYVHAPIMLSIDDEDLARRAKAFAAALGVPDLGNSKD